jgi:hypothetical protein
LLQPLACYHDLSPPWSSSISELQEFAFDEMAQFSHEKPFSELAGFLCAARKKKGRSGIAENRPPLFPERGIALCAFF